MFYAQTHIHHNKLSAHHLSVSAAPPVINYGAPDSTYADFNTSFHIVSSSDKTNLSFSTVSSYNEKIKNHHWSKKKLNL